ncbi:hypothetical protein LPB86_02985 [Pedobacter sp. MC2016-14]|uniref:hypothetical protein n=1 Tax=Pedobacter sp. MC2016-14 TaxID=2897327 RepID=UPI001E63FB5C|nr:hypothetical protein [Pedobacter sp. MC2016-14]MCD0487176.1 hypothetical protein [Pedobacter sp. MC2016-14]
MDRKKKKLAATKTAALVEQQRKAIRDRFISRTKEIIRLVGGEELLLKFNPIFIEKLYSCRYPSLKAKAAPGVEVPKTRVVQFHKLLHELMEGNAIIIPNGNAIPLSWYLSEAQTLIDAIGELEPDGDPKLIEIKRQFTPFFTDSKIHRQVQDMVMDLVTETCRYLSDYNEHLYRGDASMTPYFAAFNPNNDILIHTFKPQVEKLMTKKGFRDVIKFGWASPDFKWEYFRVKASALGFKVTGLDIPLDLYISKHTLQRLKERINITPGVMHEILLYTFMQDRIAHHWTGQESLVAYHVADQKVGYFTVKLHDNKLIVHTFLFLTNNDTPEGDKLNRLLNLELVDKKYLEIDNLPDFNAYHIDQNEKLSKLFRDAGCGSLLKLGHLQAFTVNEVADKDPESIIKYLADASYFKKILLH